MLDPAKLSGDASRSAADQYTQLATLAGGLAHEIKNPLSTIRLNMELLGEDFAEPASPRDRRALAKIQLVQSECTRLENLLNDFLRFARLGQLNLQPSDLNAEVTRALDFFQPKADEWHLDVMRYLDPELPTVQLDRETFQAALLNLILNAVDATSQGGRIALRAEVMDGKECRGNKLCDTTIQVNIKGAGPVVGDRPLYGQGSNTGNKVTLIPNKSNCYWKKDD
jgi:signal transduction histidine kinase